MRGAPAVVLTAMLLAGCAVPGTDTAARRTTPAASVDIGVNAGGAPAAAPGTPTAAGQRGPELLRRPSPPDRPAEPTLEARFVAALVGDHCVDRDLPPPAGDPALAILDRTYALAAEYVPPDLVAASAAGLTGSSGTKLVREVLLDDLAAMRAAWEAAGLTVIVESAYRSHASQAATFDAWVARLGYDAALARSARPGHSEHQLGTALDLTSPGWTGRFGDWAVESAEGAWMAAHGWEYGFVMSYPSGSQADTCFGYEPWHYRWVGRELAAAHRASGESLRRFLERSLGD